MKTPRSIATPSTLCEGLLTPHDSRPKVSRSVEVGETWRPTTSSRSGDPRRTGRCRLLTSAATILSLVLSAFVCPSVHAEDKLKALIIDGQNNHSWKVTT